jgi:very-short-patch-repair endonuclease
MNCKFCDKELSKSQVYEYLRGKTKGCCSRSCGNLIVHYKSLADKPKYTSDNRLLFKNTCFVCKSEFESVVKNQKTCGLKCSGVISSNRMKKNNPMKSITIKQKVSDTLKRIGHKPNILGGNGRGNTVYQELLFNSLIEIHKSFKCEYVFNTKKYNQDKQYSNHYKIDIASDLLMIAIEVDGTSHSSLKIKQCDKKKEQVLTLAGWRVLRFSNSMIKNQLMNCVLMVSSMM